MNEMNNYENTNKRMRTEDDLSEKEEDDSHVGGGYEGQGVVPVATRKKKKILSLLIIGFGGFGQFLAKTLNKHCNKIIGCNKSDMSQVAADLGCDYIPLADLEKFNPSLLIEVDIILFTVSILSFEKVIKTLPSSLFRNKLIVDALSVKMHAKEVLLETLPHECDILCTHPMFGPVSGANGWQDLPFMFDKVRIRSQGQCRMEEFLSLWEREGCSMIEMTCEEHDLNAARSQFLTHFVGRVLLEMNLQSSPIDTVGYRSLHQLASNVGQNSFDLFQGLSQLNPHTEEVVVQFKDAIERVVHRLKD